jgi:ABC-type molybdate transport system ATPase subunit
MNPEGKWNSESEKYGILSRELKQLAKAEDIAIITASQSNRDSTKVKRVGTQHVSLSDQITHNIDVIVHLRQSEDLVLQNILQMDIVKYRDGESKVKFELFCNWDKNYLGNIKVTKGEENKCQTQAVNPEVQGTVVPPAEKETLF